MVEGEIRMSKKSQLPGQAPDPKKDIGNLSKLNVVSFRIPTKKDVSKPKNSLDRNEARQYILGVRTEKTWVGEEIIFMEETQPFYYTATT